MSHNSKYIHEKIIRRSQTGSYCLTLDLNEILICVNKYVVSIGFISIGNSWIEISRDDARKTLQYLLKYDIAYSLPIRNDEQVEQEIESFFQEFEEDCRYFSNGDWFRIDKDSVTNAAKSIATWSPLSSSAFDGGVVGICRNYIGLIWIKSND
ncbi:MAG: hypothetical protein KDD92_14685 [Caldilineaceae bacterium]|nr:hypothetical protein [Caldilineaceae bacterium]